MFNSLQQKLESAFKKIRGKTVIREAELESTLKEVRLALLEADVNFKVTKEFCARIAEKAKGQEVLRSLSPDQQILKIVHDELVEVMGHESSELNLNVAPPAVFMLVGLQGSGKTTSAGKLAALLKSRFKRRALLVPADVYRPAAIQQLTILGKQIEVEVYPSRKEQDPVQIAKDSVDYAAKHGFDVVILDTAGRLQIDGELMQELSEMQTAINPHEILLVADAMTGQEAVNVAVGFGQKLNLTGLILTKLDGDARGGAALSMRNVSCKPIKLVGLGEKMDALEVFHPQRMASRILGMGDMLGLIEKAVQEVKIEDSIALQKKIKKNEFTLEDFLSQLKMIKRMGSVSSLASMIPGLGKVAEQVNPEQAEKELKHVEAIILSMTPEERKNQALIDGSRRRRIARGSGTSVEQVNRLLKQFQEMKKMMKKLTGGGAAGLMQMLGGKGLGGMANLMRGFKP